MRTRAAFSQDESAALTFATETAIKKGIITGLQAGTQTILNTAGKTADGLARAVEQAAKYEQIFKDFRTATNPVKAAVDDLNKKFTELEGIFKTAGASTTQYGQLEKEYNIERAKAIKDATAQFNGALTDFAHSLKISESFSLQDRQAAATDKLQPYIDKINAGTQLSAGDQSTYVDAAKSLLDIDKQLYGSTGAFFDKVSQIQALTSKAAGVTPDPASFASPFDPVAKPAFDTSPITSGQNEQTRALLGGLNLSAVQITAAIAAMQQTVANLDGGGGRLTGRAKLVANLGF